MLLLPLWGICATAILTIFMPFIKGLHEPSITLLQDFSQTVFDNVKYHLGITGITGDAGHHHSPPPIMTLSSIVPGPSYLPRFPPPTVCGYPTCPREEYNDLVLVSLITPEKSVSIIPKIETAVSVVTPFRVMPSRYTPSSSSFVASTPSIQWLMHSSTPYSPYFVPREAYVPQVHTFSEIVPWKVLAGIVLFFLMLVFCAGFIFYQADRWNQKMAAAAGVNAAAKSIHEKKKPTSAIKDLRGTRIVLPSPKTEPYLERLYRKIEFPRREISDSELPLYVIEYLYLEKEGVEGHIPADLLTVRRWAVKKSEFASNYLWSPARVGPTTDAADVVSNYIFRRPTLQKASIRQDASTPTPTKRTMSVTAAAAAEALVRLSTVVKNRHVEKTPDVNVHEKDLPSFDNGGLPVPKRDDCAGEPSSSSSSTVVPSSDVHVVVVEGTPVVNPPFGMAPAEPIVVGDEEVKNVEAEDLPLITPLPASPRLEPGEDSVPATRRRRRCRMGQRQRRKKREAFEAMRKLEEEQGEGGEEGEGEGEEEAPVGGEETV